MIEKTRRSHAVCSYGQGVGRFLCCVLVNTMAISLVFNPLVSKAHDRAACEIATTALDYASKIRGLSRKSEVPCLVSDKVQVERFLRETIATKLPPNKIEMEQLVYRALGVVPDDYDYANGIIELYVSQIGGYYDPEKKHFIMAAWIPAVMQATVGVHELTHALQDQHFDLEKLLSPKIENGDKLLALAALVEGDATAVMTDYSRELSGQEQLSQEPSIDALILQQILAGSAGGLEKTPEALRSLLLFPYTSGLRFVHKLLRKGGYSEIDRAFRAPPESSREILHPELYLAGRGTPSIPNRAELDRGAAKDECIYTDIIGEFGISAILGAGAKDKSKAVEAAKGWVGDRVGVYRLSETQRMVSWKTRWESEHEAREFEEAYSKFIEARYSKKISSEGLYVTPVKEIRISNLGRDIDVIFWVRQAA